MKENEIPRWSSTNAGQVSLAVVNRCNVEIPKRTFINRYRSVHGTGRYSSTRVPQKFSNFAAQHGGRRAPQTTSNNRIPIHREPGLNPTFLYIPGGTGVLRPAPSVIYPAASESIVAVSIGPIILAVYHDYIPEGGSIHRLQRTTNVRIGHDGFMHTVSKAMVHSTLFLCKPSCLWVTFLIFLMHCQRIPSVLFSTSRFGSAPSQD